MKVQEPLVVPPAPAADRLPPEIREMAAEYRVELSDGRVLTLRLDRGVLSVEDRASEAECRLKSSPELLQRALTGEINLLTALMRGDIRVSGNLEWAKRLHRYLRISKQSRAQP
jgi:putative sterol carrier protein